MEHEKCLEMFQCNAQIAPILLLMLALCSCMETFDLLSHVRLFYAWDATSRFCRRVITHNSSTWNFVGCRSDKRYEGSQCMRTPSRGVRVCSSSEQHAEITGNSIRRFLVQDAQLFTLLRQSFRPSVPPSGWPSVTFLNFEQFSRNCPCPTIRDWGAVYPALF